MDHRVTSNVLCKWRTYRETCFNLQRRPKPWNTNWYNTIGRFFLQYGIHAMDDHSVRNSKKETKYYSKILNRTASFPNACKNYWHPQILYVGIAETKYSPH